MICRCRKLVLTCFLCCCILAGPFATRVNADWPEHRGNVQRTGYREQKLTATHWEPYWQLDQLSPPKPAWPEPAKGSLWQKLDYIEARVTDDQADVPLIAEDSNGKSHVLVTSSANDCFVAVDPSSGEMEWKYVARAPVRYAPSIRAGVAYLGADDGVVRAIDIANGQEIWKTRIGPEMPWIVGNKRLISPHPIRTSVLVQDEVVYATAGLFPSQGVYLVCLQAKTGQVVWRRRIKQSPQGYLLADHQNLFVPTGRTNPFAVKKSSGRFMFDLPSPGGSFCMLTADAFFAGPGNNSTIQAKPNQPGAKMLSFRGKQVVAGKGRIWTANGSKLVGHSTDAVANRMESPTWSIDCKLDKSLIVSGPEDDLRLFVAGGARIKVIDATNGKQAVELNLPDLSEKIRYLAVGRLAGKSEDLLIATTESGKVYAWKGVSTPSAVTWTARKENSKLRSLASEQDNGRVDKLKQQLKSPRGLALVLGDSDGGLVDALLRKTELTMVSLVAERPVVHDLQTRFQQAGWYGHRVAIWHFEDAQPLPFSKGLFNVVIEDATTQRSTAALMELVSPGSGLVYRKGMDQPEIARNLVGAGNWRHQYASPGNVADSRDQVVGNAAAFRLLWFGGVGPSRMPDRHLRGPAPLSAGNVAVMQGDGVMIGIDPANGTERWQRDLPERAMRYVTPYDAGYACLNEDGSRLFVAANQELWMVDGYSGKMLANICSAPEKSQWGYVAELDGFVYATTMKPTAPRTAQDKKTRYSFVNSDYRSERPLVTSREFKKLGVDGEEAWSYSARGVILNGSIALDEKFVVFVEARSPDCVEHQTDRIPMSTLMEDAALVCLDSATGNVAWKVALEWEDARNMLYAQLAAGKVILTSSRSEKDTANYVIRVVGATDGALEWEAEHRHVRKGLFHGEQVHHPVILRRPDGMTLLVAEPYLYELATGKRTFPNGTSADWALRRPGHSCGTLSGAGNCLFFRAGNPTVLNLSAVSFTALAPTRAGCWINMIPAGGRLLIPEGSASCVCNYSLQTSMAFTPIAADMADTAIPVFPDVVPEVAPLPVKPLYSWDFNSKNAHNRNVKPSIGDVGLQSVGLLKFTANGLRLDGKQWLANNLEQALLPEMPETISLEAKVIVENSPKWSGLIGAVQDNGNHERGCMLGIHDGKFFFSLASVERQSLTYLESPKPFDKGRLTHIVGTYDGKVMRLYLDGKQVAESDQQSGPLLIDRNSWLAVGAYKDDNECYPFEGTIQTATIYQGALKATSVWGRQK